MFKYIICWFLANYSYENVMKTYNSYNSVNEISEVITLVKDMQEREDLLRQKCNLELYTNKKQTTYYTILQDSYSIVSNKISDTILDNIVQPLSLVNDKLFIMGKSDIYITSGKELQEYIKPEYENIPIYYDSIKFIVTKNSFMNLQLSMSYKNISLIISEIK